MSSRKVRKTIAQIVAAFVMLADLTYHFIHNGEPRDYSVVISFADIAMWWYILYVGDFWKNDYDDKKITIVINNGQVNDCGNEKNDIYAEKIL